MQSQLLSVVLDLEMTVSCSNEIEEVPLRLASLAQKKAEEISSPSNSSLLFASHNRNLNPAVRYSPLDFPISTDCTSDKSVTDHS